MSVLNSVVDCDKVGAHRVRRFGIDSELLLLQILLRRLVSDQRREWVRLTDSE